jgi:hypothetical protein
MIGLAGVYNDTVDKNKSQEENSMEYGNIIAEKIQDLLAILDASEAPAVYGYLGKYICGEEDELHFAPMSIVNTLQKMQPLPQPVWDFIIEVLELEAENGNDDAMNDLGVLHVFAQLLRRKGTAQGVSLHFAQLR